jgi:hypothetical protein
MSTSTTGGERRSPSTAGTGRNAARGKAPAGKARAATGSRGGGLRRPVAPFKVIQGRNWGLVSLFVTVGLIAAGIIGYGGYAVYQNGRSWQDRAASIDGIVDYRAKDPNAPDYVDSRQGFYRHLEGAVQYPVQPPVGGRHNAAWQRCQGDVYDAPIANEHALHSLEHGAVWITYRPDLPKDQVEALAAKVRGTDHMLMSPFEGLDRPISLQAWGFQLKLDNANDGRIDEFIRALRVNASTEGNATCSTGNYVNVTGTTPRNMTPSQNQQQPGG